jgi:hypothetical protein
MKPIDYFYGQDRNSMAANNTSGFNCRFKHGTKTLSQHAYGNAIDINPVINPYVSQQTVLPEQGKLYLNRTSSIPGEITHDSAAYKIFKQHGWQWGGDWRNAKDYQHFQKVNF